MWVRIRHRDITQKYMRRWSRSGTSLYVYLRFPYRNEEGKPRNKEIYLGSWAIRDGCLSFWGQCLAKLNQLELSEDDYWRAFDAIWEQIGTFPDPDTIRERVEEHVARRTRSGLEPGAWVSGYDDLERIQARLATMERLEQGDGTLWCPWVLD